MPVSPPSTADFRYDAFISYSHHDQAWVANVLLPRLEGAGLRICLDTRDFEVGAPALTNMENAVQQSRKTLLVLTPDWVASEWTNFESLLLQTADPIGRGRRILPLLVRDCTLPDRLRIFTYLDLRDPADLDRQMARLLAALHAPAAIPGPATAPAPPAPRPPVPGAFGFSYDRGLQGLGNLLANADSETRLEFSVLESRLRDNLRSEQLYGSSEAIRHERAQVVEQLNRLSLARSGRSFTELCAPQTG